MGRRFIVVLGQCRWFLAVVHCGSLPKAQSRDPTDSNPVFDPSSSTTALSYYTTPLLSSGLTRGPMDSLVKPGNDKEGLVITSNSQK